MSVRAKFQVNEISRTKHWVTKDDGTHDDLVTIKMTPVTGGSEEDDAFWAATPSGRIELGTVNADAVKELVLGESYYVNFTPA